VSNRWHKARNIKHDTIVFVRRHPKGVEVSDRHGKQRVYVSKNVARWMLRLRTETFATLEEAVMEAFIEQTVDEFDAFLGLSPEQDNETKAA
jgi:hypothetical protein